MNKVRTGLAILLSAGLLLGIGFWHGRTVGAQLPEPGSPGDPLVTLSWVTEHVATRTALVVVDLPAGARLIGEAGTELVLRSGQATAIDSLLGGLANVTRGVDLRMGEAVPANHLLIVPRGDGRGLFAVTPLVVMVRGGHRVTER